MSDGDHSLIAMTLERLNAKFDDVIDTIGEMKVTISNANSNNVVTKYDKSQGK